jgi:hypothetical protein
MKTKYLYLSLSLMSSFFPEYATSVIHEPYYDSSQPDSELTPPPSNKPSSLNDIRRIWNDWNSNWNEPFDPYDPFVPFVPSDKLDGPFYFIYQNDTTKCLDGGTAMQNSKGLFECQQGNYNQQFYIDYPQHRILSKDKAECIFFAQNEIYLDKCSYKYDKKQNLDFSFPTDNTFAFTGKCFEPTDNEQEDCLNDMKNWQSRAFELSESLNK